MLPQRFRPHRRSHGAIGRSRQVEVGPTIGPSAVSADAHTAMPSSPVDKPVDAGSALAALRGLALATTTLHPDDIPRVVAEHGARLGLDGVTIYLADIEQRTLTPFVGPDAARPDPEPIDGSAAGTAYRTEGPVLPDPATGGVIWIPLMDSAERLGVVAVHAPVPIDLPTVQAFVNIVAETVANKSAYGDTISLTRRTRELALAAELRWAMLPPLTFIGRNVTISGIVEPAYKVAGDSFDYAVNGDCAEVAIFDAVGHRLEASRIANMAVVGYRHSRRLGLDLAATYFAIDDAIADQFGPEKFATAQLASLRLSTGELRWVNAGHPPPMIVRSGNCADLSAEVCLPLGLAAAGKQPVPEATEQLEPGDIVLFFTDGVVEARSVDGEEFGRDRLKRMLADVANAGATPAETLRLLGHAVLDHLDDNLEDDATMLLLTWDGPEASAG